MVVNISEQYNIVSHFFLPSSNSIKLRRDIIVLIYLYIYTNANGPNKNPHKTLKAYKKKTCVGNIKINISQKKKLNR